MRLSQLPQRTRPAIQGVSAILLPLRGDDEPDWEDFDRHVARTVAAGLIPAVNMDTGYANLIDEPTRVEVLRRTSEAVRNSNANPPFVAGAFVSDQPGAAFGLDAYRRACATIEEHGGVPVVFPSYGLTTCPEGEGAIVDRYESIAGHCRRFIAFELAQAFAPFGRVFSLDTYERILDIDACVGAKHSSLEREPEWKRLELRDRKRPDFRVYTGNDLAIDMVAYGSDYLLGLSTFAPDWFALRDRMWAEDRAAFWQWNDLLQYLGCFVFRDPVPAYKHSAAMFLHLRGWIGRDLTYPGSPMRPASDYDVLRQILATGTRLAEQSE